MLDGRLHLLDALLLFLRSLRRGLDQLRQHLNFGIELGKLRAGTVQFLDFLLAEHTAFPIQLGALDLAVQALKLLLAEISLFLGLFHGLCALAAEFLQLGFTGGNVVLPVLLKNGPRLGVQLLDFLELGGKLAAFGLDAAQGSSKFPLHLRQGLLCDGLAAHRALHPCFQTVVDVLCLLEFHTELVDACLRLCQRVGILALVGVCLAAGHFFSHGPNLGIQAFRVGNLRFFPL